MTKKSIFKDHYCYVSGPMDSAPNGGKDWRLEITPFLQSLGIKVLDPTRKAIRDKDMVEDEHTWDDIWKMKEEGRFDEIRPKYGKIRSLDLRMTDLSSFAIFRLDYSSGTYMTGTLEELVLANQLKRPCLIYVASGDKKTIPLWIWLMIPSYHIFSTIDEIKDHLLEIDKNDGPTGDELRDNRWIFFDWNKL